MAPCDISLFITSSLSFLFLTSCVRVWRTELDNVLSGRISYVSFIKQKAPGRGQHCWFILASPPWVTQSRIIWMHADDHEWSWVPMPRKDEFWSEWTNVLLSALAVFLQGRGALCIPGLWFLDDFLSILHSLLVALVLPIGNLLLELIELGLCKTS